MFDWRWDFAFEILPRLLQATLNTLAAAGIGYGIAVVLGLVFCAGATHALALRHIGSAGMCRIHTLYPFGAADFLCVLCRTTIRDTSQSVGSGNDRDRAALFCLPV